jgi:predicted dinucleotide-binding enzyme
MSKSQKIGIIGTGNVGGAIVEGKKVVLDVTNALTPEMSLALGYTSSGAEELQKKLPGARS